MFGDSGGAVMAPVDGGWELIGVHSFITSMGGPYGVYGDHSGSTAVWNDMPRVNSVIPAPSGMGVLGLGVLPAARRRR